MNEQHIPTHQIVAANDIVEVIGSYFPLKAVGSAYKALCPFHDEQTPSFTVDRVTQTFRCAVCDVRGDVVRFVTAYEHVDHERALRKLAIRARIPLRSRSQTVSKTAETQIKHTVSEHIPDWQRIEITDREGQVLVFESGAPS